MEEKVIGYTTGVFDMFHVGHLNILKKAKEQCDYLIVGVSTDELVNSYKSHAPVVPFEQRIEIVKAIKYVDEVVPQVSLDKREAWDVLKFDILFHGSDWANSELYKDIVSKLNEVGVKTVFIPYTPNVSSSILREKKQELGESN